MKDLNDIFDTGFKFHGHKCPAISMGMRAGLAAMRALGVERSLDKELLLESETGKGHAGCFLDGLMTATGCTYGKSNVQKLYYNKMAFTLIDVATGRTIRVSLKPDFFEQFVQSPFAKMRKAGVPPHLIPAEITDPLVNRILALPETQFLTIDEIAMRPVQDKEAIHFNLKRCSVCGESVFTDSAEATTVGSICIPCSGRS